MITRKIPWTRQPPAGTPLDWGHAFLRDAEFVLVGNTPHYNPKKVALTLSGYGSTVITGAGVGVETSATKYASYPIASGTGGTTPWTVAGVFTPTVVTANGAFVGVAQAPGSGTNDRDISCDGNGKWLGHTYDGAEKSAVTSVTAVVGTSAAVVSRCGDGLLHCLASGGSEAEVSVASNGYTGYGGAKFCIGNANDVNSAAAVLILIRSNTKWSKSLAADFVANPWQLYAPRTLRIPTSVAAAPGGFKAAWARNSNSIINGGGAR